MGKTYICPDEGCLFHQKGIELDYEVADMICPICHSPMQIISEEHWLSVLSREANWIHDATAEYPCVIAYEYKRLQQLCAKHDSFGALLCLKDNYEALVKYETLIVYAWAASNMDDNFIDETVAQITIQNPSFGTWVELARLIVKELKKINENAPISVLEEIVKAYAKNDIVGWRNSRIGHGVLGFEEDKDFRDEIVKKISAFNDILKKIDERIRSQKLMLKVDDSLELLSGYNKARNLSNKGEIFVSIGDYEGSIFSVDPFIVLRQTSDNHFGVYFFDNQKKASLTNFQAYAEGKHAVETIGYFERLRKSLDQKKIRVESIVDESFLTEEESKELDIQQMSHDYVCPEHIRDWLANSCSKNDKGVFLLKMNRGMGKSVFSESISKLNNKPTILSDEIDVRTYHLSRTQSAGIADMLNYIEWMWSRDFLGRNLVIRKGINDYCDDGESHSGAICAFLRDIRLFTEKKRNAHKILLVFDGLDEVLDASIFSYIPQSEELPEGVYILLTSRDPGTEDLTTACTEFIKAIAPTEEYVVLKNAEENLRFLDSYIASTRIKNICDEQKKQLYYYADYRVLYLGMLANLIELGVDFDEVTDMTKIISCYLATLLDKYGEKDAFKLQELLAVLATLGELEPLDINAIGELLGEGGVSFRLVGMIKDLTPLLSVERGVHGNVFHIVNQDVAIELIKQLPLVDSVIDNFVTIWSATVEEMMAPECFSAEATVCAHIYELLDSWDFGRISKLDIKYVKKHATFTNCAAQNASNVNERARVVNYATQYLMLIKTVLGEDAPEYVKALMWLGTLYWEIGDYKRGIVLFQEADSKSEIIFGAEADRLRLDIKLMIVQSLSALHQYNAALDEAKVLYDKCIDFEEETLLVECISKIGALYGNLGDTVNALEYSKMAYEKGKTLFGESNDTFLKLKSNYALTIQQYGNPIQALSMLEEVYKDEVKAFGLDNEKALTSLQNLAMLYIDLGRPEEAFQKLESIYNIRCKVLGEAHPKTINTLAGIGTCLAKLGRNEEALQKMEAVYTHLVELYGESSLQALEGTIGLSVLLQSLGKAEEAMTIVQRSISKLSDFSSNYDPQIYLVKMHALLLSYSKIGATESALAIAKELYDTCCEQLGNLNRDTLLALSYYVSFLRDSGKYDEAISASRQLCVESSKAYGASNTFVIVSKAQLGRLLIRQGIISEALEVTKEAYETIKAKEWNDSTYHLGSLYLYCLFTLSRLNEALELSDELSRDYTDMIKVYNDIENILFYRSKILQEYNRLDEALDVLMALKDFHMQKHGPQNIQTVTDNVNIARVLVKQKKKNDALLYYQEGYDNVKELLGPKHDNVIALRREIDNLN